MSQETPRADGTAPPPPPAAERVFGTQLPQVVRFADLLADSGVSHGLIGPREAPRLWERHLLNCGVVEQLVPAGASLIDIGSGAGLPGMVLALGRPDLSVTLVEPLLRRTRWLEQVVAELRVPNVTIARGRAEEFHGELSAAVVTARAVTRLRQLAQWSLPLVEPGGRLLALKGQNAEPELAEDWSQVQRWGGAEASVVLVGEDLQEIPTRVIEVRRSSAPIGRGVKRRRP